MLQIAWIFALAAAVVSQDSTTAAPTTEQLVRAIEELGAPTFEARQAATELLWRAGQAAEAALAQAARNTDPEVRTRAVALLSKLR